MIVIWKRNGLFVPFIVAVIFWCTIYGVDKMTGDADCCSYHYWTKMLAVALAAILVWFIG